MIIDKIARAWYNIRWWRWYLFTGSWPIRVEEEKMKHEPSFRGTFPNRKSISARLTYLLNCTCGKYTCCFETENIARNAAILHATLGKEHTVTCSRRTSFYPDGVVVFVAEHKEL